jgi:flagellar motor protein MotB
MARNRLNPWPSVADLFSALSVVAFAALIAISVGAVILTDTERIEHDTAKELAGAFKTEYQSGGNAKLDVAPCKDRETEECIEIPFRFVPDQSELQQQGVREVNAACNIYKTAVDDLVERMRKRGAKIDKSTVWLLIEGHTDSRIPEMPTDARRHFLYNWKLSSDRAQSVLYQFGECGVSWKTGYHIQSVGLADTSQLCDDEHPDSACHEKNRRTTMRIRVELHQQTGSPIK